KTEQGRLYDKINASYDVRRILIQYKRWREADTVITGIGQSYTQISPLAIARYVGALSNGGKVLETSIVNEIISEDGDKLKQRQPNLINKLDVAPEHINAVLSGMY